MARFVIDANVIVSAALLPSSIPRRAFDTACVKGSLLLSQAILTELDDVLRRPKLDKYVTEQERLQFLVALLHEGELIDVSAKIRDCPDPKDNRYLELAVDGLATCIVSGDSDLLDMSPYRDIPVLKPRDFVNQYA